MYSVCRWKFGLSRRHVIMWMAQWANFHYVQEMWEQNCCILELLKSASYTHPKFYSIALMYVLFKIKCIYLRSAQQNINLFSLLKT